MRLWYGVVCSVIIIAPGIFSNSLHAAVPWLVPRRALFPLCIFLSFRAEPISSFDHFPQVRASSSSLPPVSMRNISCSWSIISGIPRLPLFLFSVCVIDKDICTSDSIINGQWMKGPLLFLTFPIVGKREIPSKILTKSLVVDACCLHGMPAEDGSRVQSPAERHGPLHPRPPPSRFSLGWRQMKPVSDNFGQSKALLLFYFILFFFSRILRVIFTKWPGAIWNLHLRTAEASSSHLHLIFRFYRRYFSTWQRRENRMPATRICRRWAAKRKRQTAGFMQLGTGMKLDGSLNGERRLISFKNQFPNEAKWSQPQPTSGEYE